MKKKLLAILLTVCMVLSMAPAALAADSVFTDVEAGDWFAEEVKYVYDNGLMNGVGDNAFDPSGTVTRAMVWTTLARLDGVDTTGSDPWWLAGQKWAMENEISDGTMATENITREQLVTMIWRYAKYIDMDVSEGEDTNILSYTDAFDVNEWAIPAMQWACAVGIINGIDGALQPQGDASRPMLATILYRFVEEVMPEEEPKPTPSTPSTPTHTCVIVSTVVTEPTCTEEGYTTYTSCCGYSFKGNYVDVVSHVAGVECPFCGVTEVTTVAQIQAALNAGGTVVLSDSITVTTPLVIPEGVEVVLDLNGKTIDAGWSDESAGKHSYAIINNGTLTITGNGTINARGIYNYGEMTLKNGTINAIDGNGGYAVQCLAGASFTMNGGTVATTLEDDNRVDEGGYDATTVRVEAGATFTMNGGEINNICDYTFAIDNHGTTTVKNGKISSVHSTVANYGTMTIEGGEFTCNGVEGKTQHVLWAAAGTTTISGGTFDGKDNFNGFNVDASDDATVIITGGNFRPVHSGSLYGEGTITVSGGTFYDDPSARVAKTHKAVKDGEVWTVVERLPGEVLNTEELQAALDAATDGTLIQLSEGVNYGTVYVGRPTKDNDTVMLCETHSFTTTDAAEFAAHLADGQWHTTPKYTTTLANVTIVGAEGATVAGLLATSGHAHGDNVHDYVLDKDVSGSAYFNTLNITNLKFSGVSFTGKIDINTSDATSVYDGVTFEKCTFTTGGTASSNGAAIRYYNEADNGNVKNLTVIDCDFTNCYQGIYVHHVNGVSVTISTFNTTGHNAIALQGHDGAVNLKTIEISGNTFENIADRVIRFGDIGADSAVTISGNTITNSGDEDGEVIKYTTKEEGASITLTGNTWDGCADAALIYNNGVWMLPVVMTADTSAFVAAMQKVPAGVAEITLVDAEGDIGMVIAPAGENSTLKVYSKEGLLYLTTLFDNWTACFTDGNGNTYTNYANGAGVDYYYSGRWTVSLEADVDLNNATIDPVTITFPVSTGAITFDGNNHTIKNAKIVTDAATVNEAGLFKLVYNTAMKNLKLDNIHVTGSNVGNSTAGILAGSCNAGVNNITITITNSSVTGGKYTGGVVGYGYTDVLNCTLTNVTVKGGYKLGGVIGYICASNGNTGEVTGNTLTNCTVDGIGDGVYAGGKSEYVIGKVVGNYNCDGTCDNNTVTEMNTTATENIGKIEAGKTVTQ